jgi:hypothetical protein
VHRCPNKERFRSPASSSCLHPGSRLGSGCRPARLARPRPPATAPGWCRRQTRAPQEAHLTWSGLTRRKMDSSSRTPRKIDSAPLPRPQRTTDRGRGHAFRPGLLHPRGVPRRSAAHPWDEEMQYIGREARLQGFSPLESSLSPRGGLDHLVPGALLGFQPLQGLPPGRLGLVLPRALLSQAWLTRRTRRCLSSPQGLRRVPAAPEAPKSLGWLPLRVSQNDQVRRSLARATNPHEVPCLIVRPRSTEVQGSWLIVSPQVPRCVAVL